MNNSNKIKVLVTGSTGFVGASVVECLVERGYDVTATGRKTKNWTPSVVLDRFVPCDILGDDLSKLGIADVVVHLAAQQPRPNLTLDDYYQTNLQTVARLMSFAKKTFIYTSTCAVSSQKGSEKPASYYGLSKLMAEKLIDINTSACRDRNAIIFRLPSVVGKNHHGGILHEIVSSANIDEQIELYSNGQRYRNLLHIDSLSNAIERGIVKSSTLNKVETFNLGSSNSMTLECLAKYVVRLMGSKSRIVLSEKKSPSDMDVFMESTEAASKLGVLPLSLQETVNLYLSQLGYKF